MAILDTEESDTNRIRLVVGDTLTVNVTITNSDSILDELSTITFSCKKLGIVEVLGYDSVNKVWRLVIDAEDTESFTPMTTDYDLTIKFLDGEVTTVVYRNGFAVLPKTNPTW